MAVQCAAASLPRVQAGARCLWCRPSMRAGALREGAQNSPAVIGLSIFAASKRYWNGLRFLQYAVARRARMFTHTP